MWIASWLVLRDSLKVLASRAEEAHWQREIRQGNCEQYRTR